MVKQQDSRRESIRIGEFFAPADPAAERLEGFDEFEISVRSAIKRPTLSQQAASAVIFGRYFQPDRLRGFFRNRHAGGRNPDTGQRAAEAGVFQGLSRGITIIAVADQQKLEPPGPVRWLRIVDVPGGGI